MAKARDYADWTAQIEKDSGTINVFGLSKQTLKKRVSVPPQYINKMRLAVEKQLTHELYKYNEDVEGAIVSFDAKSMRPLQSTTSLQNSPGDAYLHFSIKVDIVLFAPKPSMYLTGVCTEITDSYISCLVCDIFNCTISLIDKEGRRHEMDLTFGIDDQIKFRVEKIEVDEHGLLVIQGNPNDMVDFNMKRG